MRLVSVLALAASSASLAACVSSGLESRPSLLAKKLETCSLSTSCTIPEDTTTTDPTTDPDTDTDTDSGVGTGTTNTGNTTNLTTGDTTLILESSKLKSTTTTPGLSRLTVNSTAKTAKIEIDTKTTNKALWPKPKNMAEYEYGSARTLDALGGTYNEYRALSYNDDGSSADEVLQVWNWNDSYATQYRDLTDGGEAGHQAWSFGGTKTATMPTTGTASYSGRFTTTAKTWGWVDPQNGRIVSANNLWRVAGTATATADFGTNAVAADLAPETWVGWANLGSGTGFQTITVNEQTTLAADAYSSPAVSGLCTANTNCANDAENITANANYNSFMNDHLILRGTISGSTVAGTASMDAGQGWVTNGSVNPMNAGFFGTDAAELTGVFNLEAVSPDPVGGDTSINDDHRGFIQQSGAFNAQKTP